MRAVRLVEPGQVRVEDAAEPVRDGSTVLVRTLYASICGSDLHSIYADPEAEFPCPPGYPGHEAVGEVVESGSTAFAVGDQVLTVPHPREAATFAEFQVLPEPFLVGLPAGADSRGMLMAQQLGTVIFALKRMWPGSGADVATVIGAGSAGLHFTQLLKQRGFTNVIVSDLSDKRLAKAKALGADVVVAAGTDSVVEATMEVSGGTGADLVVEAAGRDVTRAQAMSAVRERGRIGLFGLPEHPGDAAVPYDVLFRRQPTIEIAYGAQLEPDLASFREAVRLIGDGRVAAADLVSHVYALDDFGRALQCARDVADGAVKVCLSFPATP